MLTFDWATFQKFRKHFRNSPANDLNLRATCQTQSSDFSFMCGRSPRQRHLIFKIDKINLFWKCRKCGTNPTEIKTLNYVYTNMTIVLLRINIKEYFLLLFMQRRTFTFTAEEPGFSAKRNHIISNLGLYCIQPSSQRDFG